MSRRNGDRSRFNRLRKRKISLRQSIRKLRTNLAEDRLPAVVPVVKA
jgi:hypothetical protein